MQSSYKVWIRWTRNQYTINSSDNAWTCPTTVDASSPEEAAQKRVDMLGTPQGYESVLVQEVGGSQTFGDIWQFNLKTVVARPVVKVEQA